MTRWIFSILLISVLCAFTLPNFQLTVIPSAGPVIAINGSSTPNQTINGTSMTVTASGGPGLARDFLMVCISGGACDGGTYASGYLNCTETAPSTPYPTATPTGGCVFTVPTAPSNQYYLEWVSLTTSATIATLPFTVPSGPVSITALTVSPNSTPVNQTFAGALTAACSVTCPGSATFAFTTDVNVCKTNDNAGADNNNLFTLSGSTLSATAGNMSTAGTFYACISVSMTGVQTSPVDFEVAVTVTPAAQPQITSVSVNPNSCTIVSPATTCNFSGTLIATCNVTPCPSTPTFTLSGSTGTGTISVVQAPSHSVPGAINPTTTCSMTANPIGTGNTVVGFMHSALGATLTSVVDNAGHTYTVSAGTRWQPYFEQMEIWYLTNVQGNPTTFTFTFASNVNFCNMGLVEYAGATGINAVVQPVSNATGPDPSITITPTTNSMIWAFAAPNTNCPFQSASDPPNGTSGIENAGYSLLIDNCTLNGLGVWSSNSTVTSGVTQTLTWSNHEFWNASTCADNTATTTGCSVVMAAVALSGISGGGSTIPTITSSLSASGVVGTAFSYQITASGSPTSFNATGLPAGLSVNTVTGVISGTPTAAGTSNVTISATNPSGTGSAVLALTINSSGGSASITVNGSSTGTTVNASASMTVAVANGPGNNTDWMGICTTTVSPTTAECDGSYSWTYLNCSKTTVPTNNPTSGSCPLTAPSANGSYFANFMKTTSPPYTVYASAPFTVTGGGTGGGGACTSSVGGPTPTPCPMGLPAPAGYHWNLTFDDEFTQDSSLNTSLWTNVSFGQGRVVCCDSVLGVQTFTGTEIWTQGSAGFNQLSSAGQVFGFWEVSMKLPTDVNGEGDGRLGDVFLTVEGGSYSTTEQDYNDKIYSTNDRTYTYAFFENGSSTGSTNTTYGASNGSPLDQAFHVNGEYWANDSSGATSASFPNGQGSVQYFYDGTSVFGPNALSTANTNFANGFVFGFYDVGCSPAPVWSGTVCGANSSPSTNPLNIKYARRWQLVPG